MPSTGPSDLIGNVYILGSGSEMVYVEGTLGELFTISDSNSGSLFAVNDISGLPILSVISDASVLIGDSTCPSLNITKKVTTGASGDFELGSSLIPYTTYNAAFFEYTATSGPGELLVGTMYASWDSLGNIISSSTQTSLGTTAPTITTFAAFSGTNIVLSGSTRAAGWDVKAIIRAI